MADHFNDPEMAAGGFYNDRLMLDADELEEEVNNLSDAEMDEYFDDISDDNSDGVGEERNNYIIKSDGEREYLLSLDEMNESELKNLLEELKYNPTRSHFYTSLKNELPPANVHYYPGKLKEQNTSTQPGQIVSPNLYPDLHVLEVMFYFCSFWMGAGYSLYMFYRAGQKWSSYLALAKTRSIFGYFRDASDIEWYVWPSLLLPHIYLAVIHGLVACFIRKRFHRFLCPYYILSSCTAIYLAVGPVGLVLCLTVPSIMFTVHLTRNKQLVWAAWWLILLLFNAEPVTNTLENFMFAVSQGDYKVSVMVAWIILRSLSYCLETCDTDPDNNVPIVTQLLTLFAYCLYLPLIFTGPYMPYIDFIKGLNAPYLAWTKMRVFKLFLQFARFLWWYSVATFLTHNFYGHAFHWSPNLVIRMNTWALAGFIYYLIMFFIIKYVVLYGIPGVLASIEGYEAPPPPKCVLILYRFSHLWRNFDAGLYKFMTRHIYRPWVGYAGTTFTARLQGIILVFTFVYVWHGVTPQVLLWAAINCFGVILEKGADYIAETATYQRLERKFLSDRMRRRWYGLLSMFLLMPSVASLSIFLTSLENAQTVGERVFVEGFPTVSLTMLFFMYCIAQIGFEMQNYKLRSQQKSLKTK